MLAPAGVVHAVCPGPVAGFNSVSNVYLNNPGAVLTNYFALITVDTASLVTGGLMQNDGEDIRFTDANCNLMNHWIESGMNTAATKIWVNVPSVPSGLTTISMYHNNPAATHVNQAGDVFGANIVSLFTFTENSGGVLDDWVGGFNMNFSGSAAWAAGPRAGIGAATGFTGGGRVFFNGNGPTLGGGDFTAFSVVNAANPNGSTQGMLGNYNNDGTSGWVMKLQGSSGQYMLLDNQAGDWCQESLGNLAPNTWAMIGARRQTGVQNTLFQNGVSQGNLCAGDTRNVDAAGPYEIGRSYNANYAFNGSVSMGLVYSRALGDAEISGLYNSLFPPVPPTVSISPPAAVTTAAQSVAVDPNGAFVVYSGITACSHKNLIYQALTSAGNPTGLAVELISCALVTADVDGIDILQAPDGGHFWISFGSKATGDSRYLMQIDALGNVSEPPKTAMVATKIGSTAGASALQAKGCCKLMYWTAGAGGSIYRSIVNLSPYLAKKPKKLNIITTSNQGLQATQRQGSQFLAIDSPLNVLRAFGVTASGLPSNTSWRLSPRTDLGHEIGGVSADGLAALSNNFDSPEDRTYLQMLDQNGVPVNDPVVVAVAEIASVDISNVLASGNRFVVYQLDDATLRLQVVNGATGAKVGFSIPLN